MNYFTKFSLFFGLILFLGLNNQTKSQENPKIDKEVFFSEIDDFETAFKYFKTAEKYYRKGKGTYDEALKYYLKLYQLNPKSHALNYKIGMCYLFSAGKKTSLSYLLNSSAEVAEDYHLAVGRAYQYNRKYDKAKESYLTYLSTLKEWKQKSEKPKIDQYIAECDFSKINTQDSASVFIVNLGPLINTYYDEHSAFLTPYDSNIYFTSRRPDEEPKKRVSRYKFKEEIYITNNCLYKPAEWISTLKSINKGHNVSIAGVDNNEKNIFFYEGKRENGRLLMISYNEDKNKWSRVSPVKGKINHIAYRETSIAIGPDKSMYFISDRKGSVGGKDIWVAEHKKKQKWNKPINIGNGLNTPFDEEAVYISNDGNTLYFSSKGHPGMGGFDVYKSYRQIDGSWSDPINLGYPINSPADELFYHPTPDSMVTLYSTIRDDSYGGLDIYKIQIDPRIPFSLIGSVTDMDNGNIVSANLTLIDNKTQKSITSASVDTLAGIYMMSLEDGGDYSVQIDKIGYKTVIDTINCPKEKYATVVYDYELEKLRHPFTLAGYITDIDNGKPLMTTIEFKDTVTNTVYGRQYSDSSGYYSITFEDKYNMTMFIECEDYFSLTDNILAKEESGSKINRNIALKRSKIDYTLTGVITDEKNSEAVYAAMSFYRPMENEPFAIFVSNSTNGKYTAILDEPGPFLIEIEANGFFFLNETYQFPDNQTFVAKNFVLKRMSSGAKIVVENILFNSGKSTLKATSFAGLDKLAILLIKNEDVRIEVSGHTDNVGSASVNKRISKSRALTVKNYLVSRGVESERIEYEGYGFDQPIVPNDTPEGRAKNRRVEIKVLD